MLSPEIFTDVLKSYFPEPHASLMNGILFGIDLETTRAFKEDLKTVGLIHLVVLSGSNISLLSTIVSSLTTQLGKTASLIISIVSVIAFVWFVGAEPPIVRAACMAVLASAALIFGRQYIVLYGMCASLVFIGLVWPDWLTSLSLQLSYAATIGLLMFGSHRYSGTKSTDETKSNIFSSLIAYGKEELRISLSAQVFTVPLIFLYFKQISLISPIANVLVAWTIAPLMIFGFITTILGSLHPVLGIIPSYICYILLHYMAGVVAILGEVPYASVSFQ